MLHVPRHSYGREKCPLLPGSLLFWVGAPLAGGLLGAKPQLTSWLCLASLRGLGLHNAAGPSCGFFSLEGVTDSCFCFPLGRHPWQSLCFWLLGCWPTAIVHHQWLSSKGDGFHAKDRNKKTNTIFLYLYIFFRCEKSWNFNFYCFIFSTVVIFTL